MTSRLFTTLIAAVTATALMCSMRAWAAEPLELGIESSTSQASLPSHLGGTLQFKDCSACPSGLRIGSGTRLFVGTTEVSLAQLQAYLAPGPARFLMVFSRAGHPDATRLVVSGNLTKSVTP